MTRHFFFGTIVAVLTAAGLAAQFVHHVPANYPTIQSAINAASSGSFVIVAPGTYVEKINFLGKGIVVRSSHGAAVTTIDGNHTGPVVKMVTNEPATAVLDGFTIRNGLGAPSPVTSPLIPPTFPTNGEAGGIHMIGASATVIRCVITNNVGGYCRWSPFSNRGGAGGVQLSYTAKLIDCLVTNNQGGYGEDFPSTTGYNFVFAGRGGAGGVQTGPDSFTPLIMDCTISNNIGGDGGYSFFNPQPYFEGGPGGALLFSIVANQVRIVNTRVIGNIGGAGGQPLTSVGGLAVMKCYAGNVLVADNIGGAILSANPSTGSVGGISADHSVLEHCTVTKNIASPAVNGQLGIGGVLCGFTPIAPLSTAGPSPGQTTTIGYSILHNNSDGSSPIESLWVLPSQSVVPHHSIIQGSAVGTSVIDVDPQFVDSMAGDYSISETSPAVDARPLPVSPFDLMAHDVDGGPRWLGVAPDWGAFEYGWYDAQKIGSREDFAIFVRPIGVGSPTSLDKTISGGFVLGVIMLSQGATMSSRFPILVADVFSEGFPPVPQTYAFPELHYGPGAFIAFNGLATGQSMNPPPLVSFAIPHGLAGIVVRLQAVVSEPNARNGIFATTDAMDIHIQ